MTDLILLKLKYFVYISILVFIPACAGRKSTRSLAKDLAPNFRYRFDGNSASLANKIDIAGYYRYWYQPYPGGYKRTENGVDTSFKAMLFYDDGTFATDFSITAGAAGGFEKYFKQVEDEGADSHFYSSAAAWGIYSVFGDTIKVQYLMYPFRLTPTYSSEAWYLIGTNNALKLILFKSDINQSDSTARINFHEDIDQAMPARFIPLSHRLTPNPWLKKIDFLWSDQQRYKQYKDSIERK